MRRRRSENADRRRSSNRGAGLHSGPLNPWLEHLAGFCCASITILIVGRYSISDCPSSTLFGHDQFPRAGFLVFASRTFLLCHRDCPHRLPLMHVMTRAICDVRVFVYVAERPSTNPIQVVDADIRTVSFARNLVKDTPHWFWTFDQCLPHGGPLTFRLTRGLIVTGVLGTTSVFKQLTSHLNYLLPLRQGTRPDP